VALGAGLWRTGYLQWPLVRQVAWQQQPPPLNEPLSKFSEGVQQLPKPALQPPPEITPPPPNSPPNATPSTQGEAERMAPTTMPAIGPGPRLGMPLLGVSAQGLTDTFNETHNGHRHEALDIMAPRGTPVIAAAEGNVVKLFTSKDGGLTVYQFDNTQNWCYYYAHLDHYAAGLREGVLLRKGDVLGYVGSTGDASPNAPHLHFAVFKLGPEKHWWQGTAVDPLPLLK
jgi:murein DD-endopeptidase MepM/ murein hydrolase activator NlpD